MDWALVFLNLSAVSDPDYTLLCVMLCSLPRIATGTRCHTHVEVSPFLYCLNMFVDTANSQQIWFSVFFSEELHAAVPSNPRSNGNY